MNISDGRWRGCRRGPSPPGDAPPDVFSISIPGPRRLNSLPRTAGGLGAPTMIRVPGRFVSLTRRTIPVGIVTALLAVAMLSFLMPSAAAAPVAPHFGPNVQIDVPPVYRASFFGPSPSIAAGTNGVVYLAFAGWSGSTTGDDIDFTMSSDGGRSWSPPIRVNDDAAGAAQAEPSLALDPANNIYIVWTDARSGNNDVYFAKSINGGQTFSANLRVNDVTTNSQSEPDLAVDPANPHLVHVVWTDTRSPILGPDIVYANSTDGGLSFNPSVRVNDDVTSTEQGQPAIAVAPNRDVYVVWRDPRSAAKGPDIYFAKSSDLGATWSPNIYVNSDVGNAAQQDPTIAVDLAGTIYVAWADGRNANTAPDIYEAWSANAGASFGANVQVNDDRGLAPQLNPSLAANAGKIQIAWADYRTGGSSDYFGVAGYTWDFGDGATATGASGTHVYATPGGYTATLTVWDDSGNTATDTRSITVRDVQAPVPRGSGDRTVDEGQSLFFDASASTDNVGVTSYRWDFGDNSSVSTAAASHIYARPGAYTASLTVMDAAGNSATSTFSVTVRAVSPKASNLLGMIQVLEAIIALLAAALAFVGWLLLGMRKREQRPPVPASARPMTPRREPMPPLPQAQPPRETDPLDMTFPPTPPNGP